MRRTVSTSIGCVETGCDDAVDLDVDRRAAGDEQVRGLLLRHQLEQSVEVHGDVPRLQSVGSRSGCTGRPPFA